MEQEGITRLMVDVSSDIGPSSTEVLGLVKVSDCVCLVDFSSCYGIERPNASGSCKRTV
jgi:hypothetical protein